MSGTKQPSDDTFKSIMDSIGSLTRAQLVIGFGFALVLVVVLALAVCVKLYCCQDKRKFRSSKETKCVRHQQCMTSPLDSPTRSIISVGPRAVAVETKDGPLPSGPFLVQSTNSLQRASSLQSLNGTAEDGGATSRDVIVPKTERLLKRHGESIASATLPKPSKRISSVRRKQHQDSASVVSTTGILENRMKTTLAPLSASHDNMLDGGGQGTSGRIVARLAECPSHVRNSRTSVATVEEYGRKCNTTTSSPIKPVRNRRKSGNSSHPREASNRTGGNGESIPLLVQSRATVHQPNHHHSSSLQGNHQSTQSSSMSPAASAPKGNVDEVNDQLTPQMEPAPHRTPPPPSEIPGQDELHANIAPPAYQSSSNTAPLLDSQQFLSPSALFKSSNCVGNARQSSSTSKTGPGTNRDKTGHRTNTNNAFHSAKSDHNRHLSSGNSPHVSKYKKPHVSSSDFEEGKLESRVYPRMWFVSLDNITPEPLARNVAID